MIETRLFFWELEPGIVGHRRFWGLSDMHDTGFIGQHGEGWVPVDHTLTPLEQGGFLLSVMMNRDVESL